MVEYKKIDSDTVERTVVERINISRVSEEIEMIEREIESLNSRLSERRTTKKRMVESK